VGGRGRGGDPLDQAEARRRRERGLQETELGERARAIVLMTDGEQTEGDAVEAVAAAAQAGIEVFVIGVGTPSGAPVPEYDDDGQQRGWKSDEGGDTVISRLDEAGLKALAKAGGGEDHYLRLHPGRVGMEPMVKALRQLKEGDLESRVQKRRQEAFQWLLYPGFLALLIEACISERRRRKLLPVAKESAA
jgi:Ca-activated chloride channel family protein